MTQMSVQQAIQLAGNLCQAGRIDEAIGLLQSIIRARPDLADGWLLLGNALRLKGQIEPAISAYRRAIEADPSGAGSYNNLALALRDAGQLDQAEAALRQAIAIHPAFPEAHYNLGSVFRGRERFGEAVAAFRQAIALRPDYADAYNNLGDSLQWLDRLDEAIDAYRKAVQLKPDDPQAYNNLASALQDIHRLDEAAQVYRQALTRAPDSAVIHFNYGMLNLLRGNFVEGWPDYEFRRKAREVNILHLNPAEPRWDGQDLTGRSILLHTEQGFGDAIQFARYAPLLAQRYSGVQITVACPPELVRLFKSLGGIERVVTQGDAVSRFDFHCPLPSLSLVLRTTFDTIPRNVPYLKAAAPDSSEQWQARLPAGAFKVGLTWQGRPMPNPKRSIPWEIFKPIAQVDGISFVSLQKGSVGSASAERLFDNRTEVTGPLKRTLPDYSDQLHDFADTAALIANLDLVITIDTAIAHLAGAMGKPVWVLLLYTPDWRWLLERDDSPWYPTMRLFRQPKIGDWQSVCQQVGHALRAWVNEHQ